MIPEGFWNVASQARKPRASGDDPREAIWDWWQANVNPARAGMILRRARRSRSGPGKPRASGDDPGAA